MGWTTPTASSGSRPDSARQIVEPPLISIVMPSLDQGRYIEQAIRSVVEQDYPRVELIVMDGGSTDGTQAILERYADRLSWTSAPDAGPADALNRGFARARGEILGVLNADDFYLPGSLATVARAFASAPGADLISGHGYFATASGELGAAVYSDRWHPRHFRYGACVLVQQATFFRRRAFELTGGFRPHSLCWDMELWADLAAAGARFERIDALLAAFRLHPSSITGGTAHHRRRREEARAVMARARGRPESTADRVLHVLHRAAKLAAHPLRPLRQRLFVRRTLGRWSL